MPPQDDEPFLLFKYLPEMKRLLDTDNIYLYMRAENCLSENDLSELMQERNHDRAVHKVAELVQRRGDRCLEKFLTALRRSATEEEKPGHKELLALLEPVSPENTNSPTPESCTQPNESVVESDICASESSTSEQVEVLDATSGSDNIIPLVVCDLEEENETELQELSNNPSTTNKEPMVCLTAHKSEYFLPQCAVF